MRPYNNRKAGKHEEGRTILDHSTYMYVYPSLSSSYTTRTNLPPPRANKLLQRQQYARSTGKGV